MTCLDVNLAGDPFTGGYAFSETDRTLDPAHGEIIIMGEGTSTAADFPVDYFVHSNLNGVHPSNLWMCALEFLCAAGLTQPSYSSRNYLHMPTALSPGVGVGKSSGGLAISLGQFVVSCGVAASVWEPEL